ncbi:glycoside hydrolase family 2 protein [Actinotalea ferrariae]|uniref:glycoside hydrolase family 2 protein n=1 Tax=Actinotalea ferrariae TaxID=1386098 RepID=UPI001C8CD90A|nr:glycoside hydrolase family 2 protein [Actinotalea ferrariae]MBX9243558.1 glycoside hydrolase family 2 protein [Actinotalea ferrariae]
MTDRTHVPGTVVPASEHLHDGWSLQAVDGPVPPELVDRTVPATVPGSAHTDLLAAGLIPDPYLDRNETALAWAHRTDWRWTTAFTTTAAAPDERVDLVLQGLDTVATVDLNGTEVARTANQHRSYRVDVRELVADGENALTVDIRSALEHAEEVERDLGRRDHVYPHPFNMVRKMACSFGWDWGPDLQTAGIWRPVALERWRVARLAQVRPLVTVDGTAGVVRVHVEVERSGLGDDDVDLVLRAEVAGRSAEVVVPRGGSGREVGGSDVSAVVEVTVPDVDLWWPRGYGQQPLYDLVVELARPGGEVLARVERRIGFRTVEVDRTPDEHGTSFTVVVNGRPVFVRGANWIPDDHLLTRVDRDRYARRVTQATDANINLLRIWGGGIYEQHDFYDVCDEAGVLVWQDFLFACAAYAEEEPIRGEVEAEARENVVRLMSHPSLVLWNGANENVWGYRDWGWPEQLEGRTWGLGYYTELLPGVVADLDPTRPYSMNSPYTPGSDAEGTHPNHPDHGTHHEWECWNRRDYVHYRDDVPRFCSEFGWQGPATWATLARALPADALVKESEAFLLHQKAEDGNGKLDRGLEPHLPVPEDFEDWHWATSLNQARAVAFAVEHYRSWWPRTAGSIVWQLNDCWPVTSWAAIDGDERPKPLWFALRAAYADRLLTVQPRDGRAAAVAVNDTDAEWTGVAVATRTGLDGRVHASASIELRVEPRSVTVLHLPDDVLAVAHPSREVLVVRVGDAGPAGDGREVRAVHTWVEDTELAYEDDVLDVSVEPVEGGFAVTLTARSLVRDVALLVDKVDALAQVDDQLVTLLPGETRVLRVRSKLAGDGSAFLDPRVLRSANALVTGSRAGAAPVG